MHAATQFHFFTVNVIGVGTRGALGARAPPSFLSVPYSSVLQSSLLHTVPPQSKSRSYASECVSAESVNALTPGVRVTWNTTVPPECMTSVRVEFRTSSQGPVVTTYTTTNTSETEIIQTGLQCDTNYYIRVVVTGKLRPSGGMTILLPH